MPRRGQARRTRIVRARLTQAQHDRWDAARQVDGHLEFAPWLRAIVETALTGRPSDRPPPPRIPPVNLAAVRQLQGIATNLNQLARWCNVEQRAADAAELHRLVAEIRAAVTALRTPTTTAAADIHEGQAAEHAAPGWRRT